MRYLFFSALMIFSTFSITASASALPSFKCDGKVKEVLAQWKAQDKWKKVLVTQPDFERWKTVTQDIGVWVFVETNGQIVNVIKQSAAEVEVLKINEACASMTEKKPGAVGPIDEKNFTDAKLIKLLKATQKTGARPGFIYVWSPRMVYSFTEYTRIRDFVTYAGYDFIPVLDPVADVKRAKQVAAKYNFAFINTKLQSLELLNRDMTVHFPMSLVFDNGKLSPQVLFGVSTNEHLKIYLEEQRQETRK
jgi:hypothetical protein